MLECTKNDTEIFKRKWENCKIFKKKNWNFFENFGSYEQNCWKSYENLFVKEQISGKFCII